MIGGAKSYIIFQYFKYILINIFIFIGLIWVSQILRIIELQYSISDQIFDVIKTTSLVLPSFISPLISFLLLMASFFVNYKISTNNEIIIFKQYFSTKEISYLMIFVMFGLFILNILNTEYFAVKSYHKYKVGELEIRNNLKLGLPSQNEFHIEEEVSIFFDNQNDGVFYGVEALIYDDGQFIKSISAEIEVSKKNFNLIFHQGERLSLSDNEKSKTYFDKFIYSIESGKIEKLFKDKEHFNTLELINHNDREFIGYGHNQIIQYIITFLVIFLSLKIIFFYEPKKNLFKRFSSIFLILIFIQIVNSYLIFIYNTNTIEIVIYYFLSLLNIATSTIIIYKLTK